MYTRSAKKSDGTFDITVYDPEGGVYMAQSGFTSVATAELTADIAQSRCAWGLPPLPAEIVIMTDAELLEALAA